MISGVVGSEAEMLESVIIEKKKLDVNQWTKNQACGENRRFFVGMVFGVAATESMIIDSSKKIIISLSDCNPGSS